jgi:hypothetical protein
LESDDVKQNSDSVMGPLPKFKLVDGKTVTLSVASEPPELEDHTKKC